MATKKKTIEAGLIQGLQESLAHSKGLLKLKKHHMSCLARLQNGNQKKFEKLEKKFLK